MIAQQIEDKLRAAFQPSTLIVNNESHMHNVPPGSESHFRVLIVSALFEGQSRIVRHRAVNACLAEEFDGVIHALAIQAMTPEQWQHSELARSPQCANKP